VVLAINYDRGPADSGKPVQTRQFLAWVTMRATQPTPFRAGRATGKIISFEVEERR
jgi:hypothetical protein